jgi:hypothetical protein
VRGLLWIRLEVLLDVALDAATLAADHATTATPARVPPGRVPG